MPEGEPGTPIVVCTRNDDLAGVVQATPQARRKGGWVCCAAAEGMLCGTRCVHSRAGAKHTASGHHSIGAQTGHKLGLAHQPAEYEQGWLRVGAWPTAAAHTLQPPDQLSEPWAPPPNRRPHFHPKWHAPAMARCPRAGRQHAGTQSPLALAGVVVVIVVVMMIGELHQEAFLHLGLPLMGPFLLLRPGACLLCGGQEGRGSKRRQNGRWVIAGALSHWDRGMHE